MYLQRLEPKSFIRQLARIHIEQISARIGYITDSRSRYKFMTDCSGYACFRLDRKETNLTSDELRSDRHRNKLER